MLQVEPLGGCEQNNLWLFDRLGTLAEEMYSDTELVDLVTKMSKIREPESTEIYRAVTWTPVE